MNIKESQGWIGKIRIVKTNIKTGKVLKDYIVKNRIMDNAFDEIIKSLYSTANSNLYLKHVAIGDDNTANSDDLESLYNETFRVPVVSRLRTGTGEVESRGVILDTEPEDVSGITTISEIGFFAGTTSLNWNGGVGKDTGIMIARIVVSPVESKTATEQINITRTDQFVRG